MVLSLASREASFVTGQTLVVDGEKIAGNVIPLPTDGRTAVKVEVTLGA